MRYARVTRIGDYEILPHTGFMHAGDRQQAFRITEELSNHVCCELIAARLSMIMRPGSTRPIVRVTKRKYETFRDAREGL